MDAWRTSQVGGDTHAGKGVKVGIIDTGIDVDHPCFDDAGNPASPQLGNRTYTNNMSGAQGYTPRDVNGHGTHVAGTVACDLDTTATVQGAEIPYDVSGVAPAAQLGNYNVFPGDDGDACEDILNAMEAAYADGTDVINMSLGGSLAGARR